MITLALDTTTAAGSLAVCEGPRVLAEEEGDGARPHGERLPGDVLTVLARSGQSLATVDLFVVAAGPGAFTGLRIGIAAIQGFAFALGRPCVGVSALDAHARLLLAPGACEAGALVGVWMDAARGEVFEALYETRAGTGAPAPLRPEAVGTPAELLAGSRPAREGRTVCWAGNGASRHAALLMEAGPRSVIVPALAPLARGLAWLGIEAHDAGRSGPPHAIQPLYIRRPDAELARDRRRARDEPV